MPQELVELGELAALLVEIGYLRTSEKCKDGQSLWRKIKKLLAGIVLVFVWKTLTPERIELEKQLDDYQRCEQTEEEYHFLYQQVHLLKVPPTLAKLLQIAFNAGQYNGSVLHSLPEGVDAPWRKDYPYTAFKLEDYADGVEARTQVELPPGTWEALQGLRKE